MDLETLINNPIEPVIEPGFWYWLNLRQKVGEAYIVKRRRFRAVKRFNDWILFEDEAGIRECFTMWELARIID